MTQNRTIRFEISKLNLNYKFDRVDRIDHSNYRQFNDCEQNDRPLKTNLVEYRLAPIYQLKGEIELKSSPQIEEKEMSKSRKRKNNDLLSPLPAKVSRRETWTNIGKKAIRKSTSKVRVSIQFFMHARIFCLI